MNLTVSLKLFTLVACSEIIIMIFHCLSYFYSDGFPLSPWPTISLTWTVKPNPYIVRFYGALISVQLMVVNVGAFLLVFKKSNPLQKMPLALLAATCLGVLAFSFVPSICMLDDPLRCRGNLYIHLSVAGVFFGCYNLALFVYISSYLNAGQTMRYTCGAVVLTGAIATVLERLSLIKISGKDLPIIEWIDTCTMVFTMLLFIYYNDTGLKVSLFTMNKTVQSSFEVLASLKVCALALVFIVLIALEIPVTFYYSLTQGNIKPWSKWPSLADCYIQSPSNWASHWLYSVSAIFIVFGHIAIHSTLAQGLTTPGNKLVNSLLGVTACVAMFGYSWMGTTEDDWVYRTGATGFFLTYDLYVMGIFIWAAATGKLSSVEKYVMHICSLVSVSSIIRFIPGAIDVIVNLLQLDSTYSGYENIAEWLNMYANLIFMFAFIRSLYPDIQKLVFGITKDLSL